MFWFSNSVISRGTCEVPVGAVFCSVASIEGNAYWIACITSDSFTEYSLYSKVALAVICWHISASDIGIVGGSGAAATV